MRLKLSLDNPAISKEWDYEKNENLLPDDFTGGSEKKVWWLCEKYGHSWKAAINSRFVGGNNCPICANQQVLVGFNDFPSFKPDLADEWDYDANNGALPTEFTGGSNKIFGWKCKHGHTWKTSVRHRFYRNQQCPTCTNTKVLQGFNDITTTHPHLADEWDYEQNNALRPEQFTAGADVKVWWKCAEGHSWEAFIYSRKKTKCPYCEGNILNPGVNDLMTANPKLAAQWDYIKNIGKTPRTVAANNNKNAWWICKRGHSWEAVIASRNYGRGCPVCANRKVLEGYNDFASYFPELLKEWDYSKNVIAPNQVTAYSREKVWWECEKKGHHWKTAVKYRSLGSGCPYCANVIADAGVNDLNTLRPDIAAGWDNEKNYPLKANQVTLGSSRKVNWLCGRNHSFKATVVARVNGSRCPYCIGKRPIIGETDFATIHPELLDEWDYERNAKITPQSVTAGSDKRVWWKCLKEGHRWESTVCNRHMGHSCPVCERLRDKHIVIAGISDLATIRPFIAEQWDYEKNKGLTPQDILPGSNRKVWWKCSCGNSWDATVLSRSVGSGCPKCNNKTPMKTKFIF
ncbi:hypothetical protein FACS1894219_00070 [Clostridia bacterium]|nr:hypothetical protein FACS1894219_00070 [Clostridia bacterium]